MTRSRWNADNNIACKLVTSDMTDQTNPSKLEWFGFGIVWTRCSLENVNTRGT